MQLKHLLLFALLLNYFDSFAQKEANNWYFGSNAGITFNNDTPPTALTNSKMNTSEGCATISTSKGRLLFYTDGISVWDSTHTQMPNGTGLKGHSSSTQSGVIVPRPDSAHIYYIFAVDALGYPNGVTYSEVNMKLNSGKGDVVSTRKNIKLTSPTSEKITAVKHGNNKDFWMLTTKLGTDTVYAYLITAAGVNSKPVRSKTGFKIPTDDGATLGYMKTSSDGTKIAYTNGDYDSTVIADFDPYTGTVNNAWAFGNNDGYGLEFSPKGKYLYVSEMNPPLRIIQYDAKATSKASFLASRRIVEDNFTQIYMGALQVGPDGKIYINQYGSGYLDVIHAPDSAGKACRIQHNYVSLSGKTTRYGLPTFIQSYFAFNAFYYTRNCIQDSTIFTIINTDGLDSVKWDFGDPASGTANTSTLITRPFHLYKSKGNYTVKLISFFKTNKDTATRVVYVNNAKPFLGNDTAFCGAAALFNYIIKPNKGFLTYNWSTGAKTQSIMTSTKGTYILSTIDTNDCKSADTIVLYNPRNTAAFDLNKGVECASIPFKISNTSRYINDKPGSEIFWLSDGSNSKDSVLYKKFSGRDSANIKLVITGQYGCKDSVTRTVYMYPQANISFTINNNTQCLKGNSFDFSNSSSISKGSLIYQWQFGDNTSDTNRNITGKTYLKDSAYIVSLISISDKGCRDTLNKTVVVHPHPFSGFDVDTEKQCFRGNSFTLSNTSVITKGSIDVCFWNWGDGNTDSSSSPAMHSYNSEDSFTIQLITLSDKGCSDTVSKIIHVLPQPVSDINIPIDSQCLKNNYFYFFNNTKIKYGNLSHRWDFGDGSYENAAIPSAKVYANNGTYAIHYHVVSEHGCSDSVVHDVTVFDGPKADILVNDSTQCLQGHSFSLHDNTSWPNGRLSSTWLFEDGSKDQNPDITGRIFNTGGYHPVKLISGYTAQCTDTAMIRLYLEAPGKLIVLLLQNDSQCLKDNRFNFAATSPDPKVTVASVNWNFGDASLSQSTNPIHRYNKDGAYHVTANVISSEGCSDSAYSNVVVMPHPVADFTVSEVCFPEPVQCTDKSTDASAWLWRFADGAENSLQNPLKYFNKAGSYDVTLIISSAFGCRDTLGKTAAAIVKPKPKALFDLTRVKPDNADDIKFRFNNKSSGNIIEHYWNFGDGNTSDEISPINNYSDTGAYKVTLSVNADNGCSDTFQLKTPLLFPEYFFMLPNAFSPNSDNLNDIFKPVTNRYLRTYTMQIYNRWGEKIFESHEPGKGWDGSYHGTICPDGMYLCRISLMPHGSYTHNYEQMVLLLR